MKLLITVEGKSYEVEVQVLDEAGQPGAPPAPVISGPNVAPTARPAVLAPTAAAKPAAAASAGPSAAGKILKAPIVGTIVKVLVKPGDSVTKNQPVVVMEAMKMETNVAAIDAGVVKFVKAAAGQAVKAGDVLVEFE